MIPKITRSRSKLFSYMTEFEDGARVFGMSGETYPELFEIAHVDIVKKAPKGWRTNKTGNCQYLWFPPNVVDEDETILTIQQGGSYSQLKGVKRVTIFKKED